MDDTLSATVADLPVADWVNPADLRSDPYPTYRRLREETPVAWVPSVRKVLVTDFAGCVYGEQHPSIFSSYVTKAHMVRAMGGRPMVRKDDPEHAVERASMNSALRPKHLKEIWSEIFVRNTEDALDRFTDLHDGDADLNHHYARPLAAKNLLDLIGFRDVDVDTFACWSADFIAGAGNVLEDDEIWARCDRSRGEANAALDDLLPYLEANPDASMASTMLRAGQSNEQVRANIFLTISGGVNEPQHMITNIALLLDQHPEARPSDADGPEAWGPIFDEAVRLYTPIGMVTRETRTESVVSGVRIPADSQVGFMLASANRDPAHFADPDVFRAGRTERRHLGFGSGAHMCAGKWAAEMSIGRIAMPALYRRLPDLRIDTARPVIWDGWAFRGMTALPVRWS